MEVLGGGGWEEQGVAEGDVGCAELGAGFWVFSCGLVVSFGEGALQEGLPAGLVEFGGWVVGALEELFAEVGPMFVVAEEWLELCDRAEFGAVAGCGVLLGFEGGV